MIYAVLSFLAGALCVATVLVFYRPPCGWDHQIFMVKDFCRKRVYRYWPFWRPTVIYSRGGDLYYIENVPINRARGWLEVEKREGPVPDERKSDRLEGWIEYDDGAYHRKWLSFAAWNVKSGKSERVRRSDPLYRDYLCANH